VAVLSEAQGREALKLARHALESWVRARTRVKPPTGLPREALGAFVSLHTREGALRGCIGHMQGQAPLAEEIIELAIAAGTHDPRFEPVTAAELPRLVYEISVLSPMKRARAEDVQPGTHGLMIRRGGRSGVLLPQVATEYGWDRETFLQHTCGKAGLPPDAWRDADTEISTFTAQVVSEV
jgi:AmmeMemoRadiSam system protein A